MPPVGELLEGSRSGPLVPDPRLPLADEPTAALDHESDREPGARLAGVSVG
jgi:hypothetical protein